jgi:hypothetical protein
MADNNSFTLDGDLYYYCEGDGSTLFLQYLNDPAGYSANVAYTAAYVMVLLTSVLTFVFTAFKWRSLGINRNHALLLLFASLSLMIGVIGYLPYILSKFIYDCSLWIHSYPAGYTFQMTGIFIADELHNIAFWMFSIAMIQR